MLALLGDSITTDHISPAGSIPKDGPAGVYLISRDVAPRSFNSFGSRRGNHEVMIRGVVCQHQDKKQDGRRKGGGMDRARSDGRGNVDLRRVLKVHERRDGTLS